MPEERINHVLVKEWHANARFEGCHDNAGVPLENGGRGVTDEPRPSPWGLVEEEGGLPAGGGPRGGAVLKSAHRRGREDACRKCKALKESVGSWPGSGAEAPRTSSRLNGSRGQVGAGTDGNKSPAAAELTAGPGAGGLDTTCERFLGHGCSGCSCWMNSLRRTSMSSSTLARNGLSDRAERGHFGLYGVNHGDEFGRASQPDMAERSATGQHRVRERMAFG